MTQTVHSVSKGRTLAARIIYIAIIIAILLPLGYTGDNGHFSYFITASVA